jgi:hypothetical protein
LGVWTIFVIEIIQDKLDAPSKSVHRVGAKQAELDVQTGDQQWFMSDLPELLTSSPCYPPVGGVPIPPDWPERTAQ